MQNVPKKHTIYSESGNFTKYLGLPFFLTHSKPIHEEYSMNNNHNDSLFTLKK